MMDPNLDHNIDQDPYSDDPRTSVLQRMDRLPRILQSPRRIRQNNPKYRVQNMKKQLNFRGP